MRSGQNLSLLPAVDGVMSAEMAGGFEVAQQAKPKLFACGQRKRCPLKLPQAISAN
jgi:hypothetical protein